MPAPRAIREPARHRVRFAGALLLALWGLILAFSISDRLHQAVCDGGRPWSHDCGLAVVAKGQILTSVEFRLPAVPMRPVTGEPVAANWSVPAKQDLLLAPGRAPPVLLPPS